jgi:hypothetical protein
MEARIKSFSEYVGENQISESLQYHIKNQISITESVFRPGSAGHLELLQEAKKLYGLGKLKLSEVDSSLLENTDLGEVAEYDGIPVPLDLPLEIQEIGEAEYQGRKVDLNKPKRNSGSGAKYVVYVRDPKKKGKNKIKKITFGDQKGGLTAKVSNPKARKSFAARHRCHEKKDKTKAGYWACRINRYAHLWGGKTYPGYW